MKIRLARPLLAMLGEGYRHPQEPPGMISLAADCWSNAAEELHSRFPALAERVLTNDGMVAPGFILVVNGEVLPRGAAPDDIGPDDELALIPGLAGG